MIPDRLVRVLYLEAKVAHSDQGSRVVVVDCNGLLDVVGTPLVVSDLDVYDGELSESFVVIRVQFNDLEQERNGGIFVF